MTLSKWRKIFLLVLAAVLFSSITYAANTIVFKNTWFAASGAQYKPGENFPYSFTQNPQFTSTIEWDVSEPVRVLLVVTTTSSTGVLGETQTIIYDNYTDSGGSFTYAPMNFANDFSLSGANQVAICASLFDPSDPDNATPLYTTYAYWPVDEYIHGPLPRATPPTTFNAIKDASSILKATLADNKEDLYAFYLQHYQELRTNFVQDLLSNTEEEFHDWVSVGLNHLVPYSGLGYSVGLSVHDGLNSDEFQEIVISVGETVLEEPIDALANAPIASLMFQGRKSVMRWSAYNMDLNRLVSYGYVLLLLQDAFDPLQNISPIDLAMDTWSTITLSVKAFEDNDYYVRVWDDDGLTAPEWDWLSFSTPVQFLDLGQEYDFTLNVRPTDAEEGFEFWIYKKDFLGLYKIIDKVEVVFTAQEQFSVMPTAATGGSLSPSTAQSVEADGTVSFLVTPDNGYQIDSITGCSGSLSGTIYTTGAVSADCTVVASFMPNQTPSTISLAQGSIIANPGNSIDISGTVLDSTTTGVSDAEVAVVIRGEAYTQRVSTTNASGSFIVELGIPYLGGNYFIDITAAANGQIATTSLPLTIEVPSEGYDLEVTRLSLSKTQLSPGGSVTLRADIANHGIYSENGVTATFQLRNPSGQVVDSGTASVSLAPTNTNYYEVTLQTTSTVGYYTASVGINPPRDEDRANNQATATLYAGSLPTYDEYKSLSGVYPTETTPVSAAGYTFSTRHVYPGKAYVSVNGEEKLINDGEFSLFDSNQLLVENDWSNYQENEVWLTPYQATTTNVLDISPSTALADAGGKAVFHVSTNTDQPWHDVKVLFGDDVATVETWNPHVENKSADDTDYDYVFNVPLSAAKTTYDFWIEQSLDGLGTYLQHANIQVHAPHDVSLVVLNALADTEVGSPIVIEGQIGNPGGYDEPFTTVALEVSGSAGVVYQYSITLLLPKAEQKAFSFAWNSQGLEPGTYQVKTTALASGDAVTGNNSQTTSLTVLPAPTRVLSLSGNLSLGDVIEGEFGTTILTISNNGNGSMNITGINYPSGFSGDWNGGVIAAGGSQDVIVTFAPMAVTVYGGTITISSDKTSGNNTIFCSGTGVEAPTKVIGLSGSLSYGDVIVGQSKSMTMAVVNNGNRTLTVSDISYPSGFSGNWNGGTIAAGSSQLVTVSFNPTLEMSYGGTITVNSDKTSGANTLPVSGTGVAVLSPDSDTVTTDEDTPVLITDLLENDLHADGTVLQIIAVDDFATQGTVESKSGSWGAAIDLSSLDGSNGFVLNGIDSGDYSGFSVSSAGDVNGDGFVDLVIGAYLASPNSNSYAGEIYVVFGKSSGFAASMDLSSLDGSNGFVLNGIDAYDRSGSSVSGAGDINGDGFADFVVGSPFASPNGNSYAGESYVVFGKGSGFAASMDLSSLDGSNGFVLNGIDADDRSGTSVSGAGDLNGDGFADFVIGAPYADPNGNTRAGLSYVVFGKGSGFAASMDLSSLDGSNGFVLNGIDADDRSGTSMSGAGDLNGDGFADFVIGAPYADPNGNSRAGVSYVVFGKSSGFAASMDLSGLDGSNGFVLNGIDADDRSGTSVSGAGDLNGDGFADFVIGAPYADPNGNSRAGVSYVVFGKSSGFAASMDLSSLDGSKGFVLNGIDADDYSGRTVSGAGDINGDGFTDLVIGASVYDPNGNGYTRESYVVFGKASGFAASMDLSSLDGSNGFVLNGIGNDNAYLSGGSVSVAGDINGDGFADLVIGSHGADPSGNSDAGGSYVVYGKPSGEWVAYDPAMQFEHLGVGELASDSFSYWVTNGLTSASAAVYVTVNGVNDPPVIDSTAVTTGDEGSDYNYIFAASDVDTNDTLTLSAPVLPHWLSFDPASGLLSGIPTNAEFGNHAVTLRVNDGRVDVDQSFILQVEGVYDTNPIAVSDSYDIDLGQSLAVGAPGVLNNDSDADGDAITAVLVNGPAHATSFDLNSDGSFSYTHDGSHTGDDSFSYIADDGAHQSAETTVTLTLHTVSDADRQLSVTPSSHLFGVETLNDCNSSTPVPFTLRNDGSSALTLGSLSLGGPDATQFAIGTDSCSGVALPAAGQCTTEVKFCPDTLGSKAAMLQIPSDDLETPLLTALLHNHEDTADEAGRRLPPVLSSLDVPETMIEGQSYTLRWSLLGYHEDYQTIIAFFDCTGVPEGSCGDSYGSNFEASGVLDPESVEAGNWSYSGVQSQKYNYSYNFTAPAVEADTEIVIRFYRRNSQDAAAGNNGLSLLIPGNLSDRYYDNEGRRILRTIQNQ